MPDKSQSQHILELSKELLDDIELSRVDEDKLLLKCSRLARLAGSEEVQKWIGYEMGGYNSHDPLALKYMNLTGRWTDYKKKQGYWGPLAQQQASLDALKLKLQSMKLPALSGEYLNIPVSNVMSNLHATSNTIIAISGIKTRVTALLHNFVSGVYYEREFSALANTTFELYKNKVDGLILANSSDVLKKIPSVINRLAEGDEEGISQALTTCRRILESFADQIFPPTDATIELGGNTLKLDASKHQNRINAYISQRTSSDSRRQKLRQNLSNLFNRVSAGVHTDVTDDEAFSLFLNVYLFLGEVLQIGSSSAPPLKAGVQD